MLWFGVCVCMWEREREGGREAERERERQNLQRDKETEIQRERERERPRESGVSPPAREQSHCTALLLKSVELMQSDHASTTFSTLRYDLFW